MNILVNFHDIEVKLPKEIEEAFRLAKKEGLKKGGEDKKFWEQDDASTFDFWFMDSGFSEDRFEYWGKIVDKDMAKFLSIYNSVKGDGGYNLFDEMKFEDNGFRYTIFYSAGFNGQESGQTSGNFIGYKEKIEDE